MFSKTIEKECQKNLQQPTKELSRCVKSKETGLAVIMTYLYNCWKGGLPPLLVKQLGKDMK